MNEDWEKKTLPESFGAETGDWVARCGVCNGEFVVPNQEDNPAPTGSFCPDCRNNKLKAPGVLNWKRVK